MSSTVDGGLLLVANSIGGASEMDAINQVVWAARISKSPSSSPASPRECVIRRNGDLHRNFWIYIRLNIAAMGIPSANRLDGVSLEIYS